MKNYLKILSIALTSIIIASCSSDDDAPIPVNEEEVITTVIATFTPVGVGTTVVLTSKDLDGDGPNSPEVTISGPFSSNTNYNGAIQFLNELESPAEDITEEVEEEGLEHQVFYNITNGIGEMTYNDEDINGDPIGLSVIFQSITSNDPINGTIIITLRHEPNKGGEGVSNGDITNAGGETDAQVSYNVSLQ
tara:strand:- start:9462 stop:10037 length:576 start_codon:yes stop_codon:yes gene_type:complete